MTVRSDSQLQASPTSPYFNNISIASVEGGSETSPLWTSQVSTEDFQAALENTLKNSKLLGSPEKAPYQLSAKIITLDQPLMGLDMTVKMVVDYSLKDQKTGATVFDDTITSAYTATMDDAFIAVTRLRLANEGAVRRNFELLLKKFLKN